MDLFGKVTQNNSDDLKEMELRHGERHAETLRALADMGITLEDIRKTLGGFFASVTAQLTTYKYRQQFFNAGYRFNSLFISDAAAADNLKMVVYIDGYQYTVTLTAGENRTDIPDGAEISFTCDSGAVYGVMITHYNLR